MTTPTPTPARWPRARRWVTPIIAAITVTAVLAQLGLGIASLVLASSVNRRIDTDTVETCTRSTGTREQINAGLYAVDATNVAVIALAGAVDTTAAAFVAALTPAGGLTDPDDIARRDIFLATVADATDVAEQQVAVARALLELALLPARDCANVLDDPAATLPPSTLPPIPPDITTPPTTPPVTTEVGG